MKKRFSDEQIIQILKEAEAGLATRHLWGLLLASGTWKKLRINRYY